MGVTASATQNSKGQKLTVDVTARRSNYEQVKEKNHTQKYKTFFTHSRLVFFLVAS